MIMMITRVMMISPCQFRRPYDETLAKYSKILVTIPLTILGGIIPFLGSLYLGLSLIEAFLFALFYEVVVIERGLNDIKRHKRAYCIYLKGIIDSLLGWILILFIYFFFPVFILGDISYHVFKKDMPLRGNIAMILTEEWVSLYQFLCLSVTLVVFYYF